MVGLRHRVKLGRDMRKVLAECMAVGRAAQVQGLVRKQVAQDDEPRTAMTVESASQRGTCGTATWHDL